MSFRNYYEQIVESTAVDNNTIFTDDVLQNILYKITDTGGQGKQKVMNSNAEIAKNAIQQLRAGNSNVFNDFPQYSKAFRTALEYYISKYGIFIDTNKFLEYAILIKDSDVAYYSASNILSAFNTIYDLMTTSDLEINDKTQSWLTNVKSYVADDVVYKIKALTFLTGDDVDKFGNASTVSSLVDNVINSSKRVDIEALLDEWQSRSGKSKFKSNAPKTEAERREATRKLEAIRDWLKNIESTYDTEKMTQLFNKYYAVGDSVGEVIAKIVDGG